MDRYVEGDDPSAVPELRRQFRRYVARHAARGSDIAGAEIAFSEVVTNAVRHTTGPLWVSLDWSRRRPVLTVRDLGPGFELPREERQIGAGGGMGLRIVAHLTPHLAVAHRKAGGSEVTVELPIERTEQVSFDPPRRRTGALPRPDEASSDGTFGREPFLRALTVQLAEAVEEQHGPHAAEAAVAQVGSDVGGRMEEEYRRTRALSGPLTPEQMADLYVRLKAGIDGDFYVIEANDARIVLGNRRCPFGDAVKRAPALCRMTSSVFGGIAARNAGSAAVQLEERIAVGDTECRVIVWLGEPPPEARDVVHVYGPRTEHEDAGEPNADRPGPDAGL